MKESHYTRLTDEQICPYISKCSSEGFFCKTCAHNPKNHKPDHYRPITNPPWIWKKKYQSPFVPRRPRILYNSLDSGLSFFDRYED